jgi:tellurite resistance protein TerC
MFHYLKYGLALILMFIGVKMLIMKWFHMPVVVTMAVIFSILGISVAASMISNQRKKNALEK